MLTGGSVGAWSRDQFVISSIICSFASVKDAGSSAEIDVKSADFEATEKKYILLYSSLHFKYLHHLRSMFITTPAFVGSYKRPKYLSGSILPLVYTTFVTR